MHSEKRILIADDDQNFLRAVVRHLVRNKFEVECANDGFQLLQMVQKSHPDLLIVDVNMPAGGGFKAVERVRDMAQLSTIPVIVTTGDDSRYVAVKAERLKAQLLLKPFSVDDLLALVKDQLRSATEESWRPEEGMLG